MASEMAKLLTSEGALVVTGRRQNVLDEAIASVGRNAIGVGG